MPINPTMTPQNTNTDLFQVDLTRKQLQKLSQFLPKGFSLELAPKHKVEINHQPSKKIFTNDGTVVRKPSKPAERPSESILINKNALRDPGKRKISTHLEFKDSYYYETTTTTSTKTSRVNQDAIRKCHNLLQKLKRHPAAGPFLFPVDVHGLGLTDYYDIVSEPMDLSTVETNLKNNLYSSASAFIADIRKIWNNAFMYNAKGSPIYNMTAEMNSYFEKIVRDVEHVGFNDTVRNLEKQVELLSRQITELHQKGVTSGTPEHPLKMNRSVSKTNRNAKLSEKPLTHQEKKMLTESITKLPAEYLRGVRDIVAQAGIGSNEDEFIINFDTLPVRVSRELERYVKNKINLMNRSKKNKGKDLMVPMLTSSSNVKQQERTYEQNLMDDSTTRHHSMVEEEKGDFRSNLPTKADASPTNSSESSFISDSDSDGENDVKKDNSRNAKSLQTQQELADFLAGGHGSMLNSFIVK